MDELEIYQRMSEIASPQQAVMTEGAESAQNQMLLRHKLWLASIRHERPNPAVHYKIGVYIRFFNQTKYGNYLEFHKKQFADTIELCPNWTLVDMYVDEGSTAPKIESSPELSRLIEDCFAGKVDLIITQKVSNMSRRESEITLLSQILAAQNPPIGIYFISEDIFTTASYYSDFRDFSFLPSPEWKLLPDDDLDKR